MSDVATGTNDAACGIKITIQQEKSDAPISMDEKPIKKNDRLYDVDLDQEVEKTIYKRKRSALNYRLILIYLIKY